MRKERLVSLQVVRALAFLGIFTRHCVIMELGEWGVSVFFVLSGFLMTYNYCDRAPDTSFKHSAAFSIQKIKKLYPLHILTMIAAMAYVIKDLHSDFSIARTVLHAVCVVLNLSLLQAWVPSPVIYFSLNGVAWYLSASLFLYFLFPRILKVIKSLSGKTTAVAMMALIYIAQLTIGYASSLLDVPSGISDNFPAWVTYISPFFRAGDFAIGCALGYIYLHTEGDHPLPSHRQTGGLHGPPARHTVLKRVVYYTLTP